MVRDIRLLAFPGLHSETRASQPVDEMQTIQALFEELRYDDVWDDAGVRSALRYVRGSKTLLLPEEVRPLVPRSL